VSAIAGDRSRRIELLCFAALAAVVSLQWSSLVDHPPAARVIVVVAVATGGGAALAAIGRLRVGRAARWTLAGLVLLCAVCIGAVVMGVPARLFLPAHWDELAHNVNRSLNGLADIPVPYAGADVWTRLVILLGAPVAVGLASFAAFWPRRHRAAGRICALVLLVALYLVAVAWARPGRQLAGGALLLILACAWLWLPSVAPGRGGAAAAAIGAAAVIALPAAAAVDPGRALIDYRTWNLLSANGISFRWDQSYGPLSWPQKGTLLLEVSSEHSHYWKTTNLDNFDGVHWVRSAAPPSDPALGEPRKFHAKGTAPRPNPEWVDRINFVDRGLSSDFAVGAGTVLALNRTRARPAHDAVWSMTRELHPGDQYTALVYDPKPTAAEMRGAGTRFPATAGRYVSFTLAGGPGGPRSIAAPFWGKAGPPSIERQVSGTPYMEMYSLARRITAGAPTAYDAARRIELYLRGGFSYRQNVPNHAYPLPAFLSVDHAGYCQQFSGTMALMLRMLGIPSRVATGFSPGGRDPERNNFLVDDTDAHNWVEVFFPTIGWVTFEPTPAGAPAATQLDDNALGVTKPGPVSSKPDVAQLPGQSGNAPAPKPAQTARGSHPTSGGGGIGFWPVAGLASLALLSSAAVAGYGYLALRRGRLAPDELAAAELAELDSALARLGRPLPAGATLLRTEGLLSRLAGPRAAAYAARLRDRRYRRPDVAPPGIADRRSLRRALLRSADLRSTLRVLRAIPPGGPRPRPR
jgi:transglutaminase-like putative cysteine protease